MIIDQTGWWKKDASRPSALGQVNILTRTSLTTQTSSREGSLNAVNFVNQCNVLRWHFQNGWVGQQLMKMKDWLVCAVLRVFIKKFWKSLLLLRQTWRSATSLQQLGWSVFLSLKFQVDDISNDFKPRRIFSEDYHFEKREESTVQLVGGKEERGDADLSWSARVCQVARSFYPINDWYIKCLSTQYNIYNIYMIYIYYPARALRALGLLLADSAPTVGGRKTFWAVSRIFLRKQL